MQVTVYRVSDSHGNACEVVAAEGCDIVQVSGLYGKDGWQLNFESEAYHIPVWAEKEGLAVRTCVLDVNVKGPSVGTLSAKIISVDDVDYGMAKPE